jgi:hypothetical protein
MWKCQNNHEVTNDTANYCPQCGSKKPPTIEEQIAELRKTVEALKAELDKLKSNQEQQQSLNPQKPSWLKKKPGDGSSPTRRRCKMRIIIGILIGVLLIGALVWPGWIWGHPVWDSWQTQKKAEETTWVGCNEQWFEMPKPENGSFYECENGQPKLVIMPTTTKWQPAPAVQPTPSASQPAPAAVQPTPAASQQSAAPSGSNNAAPAVTDPTPKNAVILHNGDTVIPNWGYGPWGVVGVDYVDVFPNQQATMGPVEFKTDFNGRNWVPSGCWTWQLPSGWKEIRISVQGDTPVQVTVQNNELTACSNGKITMKAQPSIDGTPKPSAGSSGFSIVTYIE